MTAAKKRTPTQARKARATTVRRSRVKATYGLSGEDQDAILDALGGLCAACRGKRSYNLPWDHNHATGEVRGPLCKRCNKVLRDVGDNADLLQALAWYLAHPPVRQILGPRFVPLPTDTEGVA